MNRPLFANHERIGNKSIEDGKQPRAKELIRDILTLKNRDGTISNNNLLVDNPRAAPKKSDAAERGGKLQGKGDRLVKKLKENRSDS